MQLDNAKKSNRKSFCGCFFLVFVVHRGTYPGCYSGLSVYLREQPVEDVLVYLIFVCLIEDLVPGALVELVGHVLEPGADVVAVDARDLHAVAADGVTVAAHEYDRRVGAHTVDGVRAAEQSQSEHHVAEKAAGGYERAQRVGGVLVHDGLVASEPVVGRAQRLDALVVGAVQFLDQYSA